MPRISAATNAAQRENTKRAILNSFGEILYARGLSGRASGRCFRQG